MLRRYQGMRRCMVNTAHLATTGQSLKLVGPRLAHQLAFQNHNAPQPLHSLEEFHHTLSTLKLKDDPKKNIVDNEVEKDQNEDKDQTEIETNNEEEDPSKERDPVDKSKKETSVKRSKLASETSSGVSAAAPPSGNGNGKPPSKKKSATDELPEVYPQIIALPISRRPLFPGFYKAVIITNVNVIKAIRESLDKGYPYIGCFLFKDENADSDIITNKDEVHEIGVLAQITSNVFSKDSETGVESLTTVLYPHKRIRIDELFPPKEGDDVEKAVESAKVVPSERPTKRNRKEIIQGITGEKEGDSPKRAIEDEDENLLGDEAQEISTEKDENPTEFLKNYPITLVNVSNVNDLPYERDSPVVNSLTASILEVLKEMSNMNKMFADHLATFSASLQKDVFQCPEKLADFAAAVTAGNENDLQDILNCLDIEKRLEKSFTILKKELMNKELQRKIEKDIEERMAKRHREYHLNEQLKWIKKELGIDDGRDKLIAKYNDRVKNLKMPAEVQKVYEDEIAKLQTLEPLMSEFTVTRNYLDWLTQIPWGKQSKDEYNIKKAITVLDEDHYGLKDVKDRILEFIAVGKLLNKINGKIVCFVGPPGVGKTSIGKSIARALNRKFYRFSVGGLSDVSEIKGHRRTYVGAIPGRVVQALKKTETENPLILIDEIDKISHTHSVNGGDPSSALLELLDPEQNNSFLDNYMDVPIDLSKVLFVCTANQLSTIPGPLLDRMEVIEISGYIADEKIKIAEKYLAPEAKQSAGLQDVNVDLSEAVIQSLIKNYCRESGVRNLKKQIEKIYRKAALNVVRELGEEETERPEEVEELVTSVDESKTVAENEQSSNAQHPVEESNPEVKTAEEVKESLPQIKVPESFKVEITPDNLKDYVGPPVYTSDRLYETTAPGVVMGLAWTAMGGSSLYIESVLEQPLSHDSTPRLEITGQLGDVMKESSKIAYSFARMFMTKNYPENKFFERAKIHLHCPEGATPKDGPSAGVTMTSSLLSLALDKPLSPSIAMTGELTLTGRVLRIGGLKEKSIAAKRSGVDTIIFPKDNLSDWKELPENIKEGLTPVPVEWYHEVFEKILPGITVSDASNVWKAEFDKIKEKEAEKEKST